MSNVRITGEAGSVIISRPCKNVLRENLLFKRSLLDRSIFKKNWPFLFSVFLVFTDLFYLNLSFYTAFYLRFPGYDGLHNYFYPWILANILFIPGSVCFGLYRGIFKASLEKQKSQIGRLTFYTGIFLMSYLYITKSAYCSRSVILIFLMSMYVILELNHSILFKINRFLVKRGLGSKKTLIIGTDDSASRFAEQLKDIYGDFYKVVGFVKNNHLKDAPDIEQDIIGMFKEVNPLIISMNIEQVFIVSDSMDISKYVSVRRACEKHHVNLKMVSPHIRSLMKKRKIKDVTGVPLITDEGRTRYLFVQRLCKRLLDLSILALGSIVIVPVCLVTAALIKLTSKGPVFFKQKRALYKGGPEFDVYKFRSMCVDADNMKKDLLKENETNGALFKMKNDPRITPVGHIIRKLSLDEFPQFINVLKGEMSVVGPRPLPVNDYKMIKNTDKLCFDWYKKRGQAVPGITGLWQISGRSELSFEEMCLLDLYYIENQSVFFDLEIMFDTACVMVMGAGAY